MIVDLFLIDRMESVDLEIFLIDPFLAEKYKKEIKK